MNLVNFFTLTVLYTRRLLRVKMMRNRFLRDWMFTCHDPKMKLVFGMPFQSIYINSCDMSTRVHHQPSLTSQLRPQTSSDSTPEQDWSLCHFFECPMLLLVVLYTTEFHIMFIIHYHNQEMCRIRLLKACCW